MFRRLLALTALVAALTLIAGCGGGSGKASLPGANEQTLLFGNLTTRIAISAQPPVSMSGTGAGVTGVAGGTVSSLVLSYPTPTLNQTRIAFTRNGHLYTISPDGTGLTQLAAGGSPVWSPDGSRIAFSVGSLYTISPDGTGLTQITNGFDQNPVWSPDGSKIAFTRFGQLYTIASDGTGLTQLTTDGTSPAWSPDGSRIAFVRYDSGSGLDHIYTISPEGTGLTQLTKGIDSSPVSPAWSPDGSRIAFYRFSPSPDHAYVYTISPDGTGLTQLTTGFDLLPVWSPDGSKIAFCRLDPGSEHLYTIAPDGTGLTQLTKGNDTDFSQVWSPDSSRIAFVRNDSGSGFLHIYTIASDGTGLIQITNGNEDFSPAWSPFIKQRTFLGTKGILGTSAAGFLFGQQGKDVQSIVAFDTGAGQQATARVSTKTILAPNNQVNLLFTISATSLTSLTFAQKPGWNPVTVIGSGGATTSANGAIVSFDATTGQVIAVLPYTTNKAAGSASPSVQIEQGVSVLRGSFLGVWDGKGKNLAPQGASEVRLDSKTGAILSVR